MGDVRLCVGVMQIGGESDGCRGAYRVAVVRYDMKSISRCRMDRFLYVLGPFRVVEARLLCNSDE